VTVWKDAPKFRPPEVSRRRYILEMSGSGASHQLAEAALEFVAARERARALLAATPDTSWSQRPAADAWSVAECIAHLNLTSAAMVPRIRAAFEEARSQPPIGERKYKPAMLGRILAATVGPVPTAAGFRFGRVRTPPAFVPGSHLPRTAVETELMRWMDDEAALVLEAEGLAIDDVRIESPFRAKTFYDGWSALLILVRHEHRHLAQAEQVNATLGATP
jgi:hypothetical protein